MPRIALVALAGGAFSPMHAGTAGAGDSLTHAELACAGDSLAHAGSAGAGDTPWRPAAPESYRRVPRLRVPRLLRPGKGVRP